MKLEALNCPNCGAPLHIQANQDLALCVYCDTTIRINYSGSGEASLTQQTTLQAEDAKLIKSLLLDVKREQSVAAYQRATLVTEAEAQKAMDALARDAAFKVIFSQRLNLVGILMLCGYMALLGLSVWERLNDIISINISRIAVILILFLAAPLVRGLGITLRYLSARSAVATVLKYAQIGKAGNAYAYRLLVDVQPQDGAAFQTGKAHLKAAKWDAPEC
jgi:ABC-type siderophore export system fused ATPase/permease subunit